MIPILNSSLPGLDPLSSSPAPRDARKWQAAQALEASFLAEMLGAAGLDGESGAFGGGIGAEQFGSFLRQGQAEAMVKAGGIGLAAQFYKALEKHDD